MPSDLVPTQVPAVIVPGATPAAPAPAVPSFDPDEYDRQEALREIAAEDAGTVTLPPPAPAPTQPAPRSRPDGTPTGSKPIMVSKGRFDAVLSEVKSLRDQVQFLKGAVQARPADQQGQQPAQPPALTVEQQLRAQAQIILDAGKRFDDGELTMVQFKQIEFAAHDVIADLRARHMLTHIESRMPAARSESIGLSDGAWLDQHVEEMAVAHPWSAVLNDGELALLAGIARAESSALGKPYGTGPAETLRLRQAVAELSDVLGPRWYPDGHPAMPAGTPTPKVAQPAAVAAGVPPARVSAGQRAIDIASRQPPNMAGAGYGDAATDPLTEERIVAMSEDELMALPAATRSRLLSAPQ